MAEDSANTAGRINITEEEVTCKLCSKFYSSPKLVECLHSFCQSCIQQHLAKEGNEHIFVCPKCLHVTKTGDSSAASLTSDLHVPCLLEVFRCHAKSVAPCTICTLEGNLGEATNRCLSCNDHLCTACSKKHTFSSLTAKHRVVSLVDLRSGKYDQDIIRKQTLFCKEHDQQDCEFFCNTCSGPQCIKCIFTKHMDHSYVDIKDAAAKKKSELLSLLQDCTDPYPERSEVAVAQAELDLLQKEENLFMKTVSEQTEEIIKKIKQQSQDCLKKAKVMFNEERTKREMKEDLALKRSEKRQNILRLCRTLTNNGGSEIVEMLDALKKGIGMLNHIVPTQNVTENMRTYKALITFPYDDNYFEVVQDDMTQSESHTVKNNDTEGSNTSNEIKLLKVPESQSQQEIPCEKLKTSKQSDEVEKKTTPSESSTKQGIKGTDNLLPRSPENMRIAALKLKLTFSTKTSTDRNSADICSTSFCNLDRFLALDKANAKLKAFKLNGQMMFLVNLTGKCKPFQQFVNISPDNYVVAVHENSLLYFTKHLKRQISIELIPKHEMTIQPKVGNFANGIIVGNLPENEMRLYNTSGKLLRRFKSKMQGPFEFLKYGGGDRLISSNWGGTGSVSLESEKKGLLVQITGTTRLGLPWRPADGVVDKEGHFIISDPGRNEISVFSSKGSLLFFHVTSVDAVFQPKCLFLDKDGHLYVTYRDGMIAVYMNKRG